MLMTPPPYGVPSTIGRQQVSTQSVPGIQGSPVIKPMQGLRGLSTLTNNSMANPMVTGMSNPNGMNNPMNMANILRR